MTPRRPGRSLFAKFKNMNVILFLLSLVQVNSFSLKVTPAKIVSFVTYSTGSTSSSNTTTTTARPTNTTTTRPTLPTLPTLTPPPNTTTTPSNSSTTTSTTTPSSNSTTTTIRNSLIDPRDQDSNRIGYEGIEEEVYNEEPEELLNYGELNEEINNEEENRFEEGNMEQEEVIIENEDRIEESDFIEGEEAVQNEEQQIMLPDLEVDTGVNTDGMDFPREKRESQMSCGCYAPAQCNNTGNTDGTGLIDFRIISGGTPSCSTGLEFCCPSNNSAQISCGSRFTPSSSYPVSSGQAHYGDYPWMVLMQNYSDGSYVGGGVLIDLNHVLTAAHRITKYPNGTGLRIRLGEWDMNATTEQYPYRDFNVSRVWIHESFNPGTLQNDVALIKLNSSVSVNPPAGITPICMPTTSQNFENQSCWVSGWGADSFNGYMQTVLRAADIPIVAPATCETALRSTRLGNAWTLDRSSFICAGGDPNKDSCTGDGGSGLVCEVSGHWVLAGLVAWGIGCATQGVPAAYVNVVNYLPWIQNKTSL